MSKIDWDEVVGTVLIMLLVIVIWTLLILCM